MRIHLGGPALTKPVPNTTPTLLSFVIMLLAFAFVIQSQKPPNITEQARNQPSHEYDERELAPSGDVGNQHHDGARNDPQN